MSKRMIVFLCLCLAFLLPAAAGAAGAIALTFNTSARAEGMGGAGVANVWGGDTDLWANPALLAFRPGVRYDEATVPQAEGLPEVSRTGWHVRVDVMEILARP